MAKPEVSAALPGGASVSGTAPGTGASVQVKQKMENSRASTDALQARAEHHAPKLELGGKTLYDLRRFRVTGCAPRHPPGSAPRYPLPHAGIAQSVEQLIRNEKVVGSIPISGTNKIKHLQKTHQPANTGERVLPAHYQHGELIPVPLPNGRRFKKPIDSVENQLPPSPRGTCKRGRLRLSVSGLEEQRITWRGKAYRGHHPPTGLWLCN